MLELLDEQLLALDDLLHESPDKWASLDINYHPPRVERLWRPIMGGTHRLYLHRMHWCSEEESFKHTHPWPAAMKVIRGIYGMNLYYGDSTWPDHHVLKTILTEGSTYEMLNPNGWHSVWPVSDLSLSVMVTGPTFDEGGAWRGEDLPDPDVLSMDPMTNKAKHNLLEDFRNIFWLHREGKIDG